LLLGQKNFSRTRLYSQPEDKVTGTKCDQIISLKAFYGTSGHAVMTQIWIAILVYVFVPIVKKTLIFEQSFYTIIKALNIIPFEKNKFIKHFQMSVT